MTFPVTARPRPLRATGVVVAVAFLIALTIPAVRWSSADFFANRAQLALGVSGGPRLASSLEGWLEVRDDLRRAERLAPRDPRVQETLGVLYAERASSPELLQLAHEHLERAIVERPTSPYSWASLAAVRYDLGRTDALFESALRNAVFLGPSEAEVQATVADLGLAVLGEVAAPTRAAIESALAAGMKRRPSEFLQIAQRRGRLEAACRHTAGKGLLTDSKWLSLCN